MIHTRTFTDDKVCFCIDIDIKPCKRTTTDKMKKTYIHIAFFFISPFQSPLRVMKFKAYFRVIIHSSENNDLTTWQKFPMFILSIYLWVSFTVSLCVCVCTGRSLANMPTNFNFINMVQYIRLTWIVVNNLVHLFSFLFFKKKNFTKCRIFRLELTKLYILLWKKAIDKHKILPPRRKYLRNILYNKKKIKWNGMNANDGKTLEKYDYYDLNRRKKVMIVSFYEKSSSP